MPAPPAFKLHQNESPPTENHALLLKRSAGLVIKIAAFAAQGKNMLLEICSGRQPNWRLRRRSGRKPLMPDKLATPRRAPSGHTFDDAKNDQRHRAQKA